MDYTMIQSYEVYPYRGEVQKQTCNEEALRTHL